MTPNPTPPPTVPRSRVAWVKLGGFGLGGLVLLSCIVVLSLRWDAVGEPVVRAALLRVPMVTHVEVDDVRSTWWTGLELRGLRLTSAERGTVELAAVRARWAFFPLLRRSVRVRLLEFVDPVVEWDACTPLPASDTTTSRWTVRLDSIAITSAEVSGQACLADGTRSAFAANGVSAGARGVILGERPRVERVSLSGSLRPPASDSSYRADVMLLAAFADGSLVIDTLSVRSPASAVRGSGSVVLRPVATDSSRLTIDLAPLAARDLQPWAGAFLADDAVARGTLSVVRTQGGTSVTGAIAITDGGSADLDVSWTDAADAVSYRGVIRAESLDPSRLLAGVPAAVIDGHVEGAVEGPSLSAASGRIELDLRDSGVPGASRSAEVGIDLRDGLADVVGDVSWSGWLARLRGTAHPFADVPEYDLTTDLRGPRPPALAPSGETDALRARVRVTGTGTAVDSADVTARLDLEAFDVGPETVGPLRVNGRLNQGVARGTLQGLVAGGRADGAFHAEWGGRPRLVLERLSVTDAVGLRYGRLALQRLDLDAALDDDVLRATAVASTTGGRIEATITGDARDPEGTVAIERGTLTGLDLGALADSGSWSTALSGTFDATVRRAERVADSGIFARFVVDSSRVGTETIHGGEIEIDLDGGLMNIDGRLGLPDGAIALGGRARPFDSLPSATVDSLVLRNVNAAALGASHALPTLLDGRLRGEGGGAWPTPEGAFELVVDRARVRSAEFGSTTVSGQAGDGDMEFEARLAGPWGEGYGVGRARLSPTTSVYSGEGDFDIERLSGLLGEGVRPGRAQGSFDFELTGSGTGAPFSPESLAGGGRMTLGAGAVADVPFDSAKVAAVVADGSIRLDSTSVWSSVGFAEVAGTLPFAEGSGSEASLSLRARAGDLTRFASMLDVERVWADSASFEATVTGVYDSLAVRATTSAHVLSVGPLSTMRTTGSFDGVIGADRSLGPWTGDLRVRSAETGGVRFDSTDVSVSWDGSEYRLLLESLLDQRRHVRLGGRFDPAGSGGTLEQLDISVDADRWTLRSEATVTLGATRRVDEFVLASGEQRIEVRGGIDPAGIQDLSVAVESFRVEGVADLVGLVALGGTVDMALDLQGSATDPVARLDIVAELTEEGSDLGVVRLNGRGEGGALTMEGEITQPDGARLATLDGTVPFSLTLPDSLTQGGVGIPDGPIDVTLRSEAFALEWLAPFVVSPSVDAPRGTLVADLRALGTVESPDLSGRLTLTNGGVRLPDVGIELTGGRVDAVLTADRIRIDTLRVQSGDGTATATGAVTLENILQPQLALQGRLDRFVAIDNQLAEATLSGDLTVEGSPLAPEVAGTLEVLSAEVHLDAELATADVARVELTEEDLRMLEATFGVVVGEEAPRTGLYEASDLRLQLTLGRDTWARQRSNPEMALQFSGDLSVDKRPEAPPEVTGTLRAIPGRSYISQFGRRFQVQSGEVAFQGPLTQARVDLTATYEVPSRDNPGAAEVTISLAAAGTADTLSLTLSSDPALENADIISYIATGQPASRGFGTTASGQGTLLGAGAAAGAAVASDQLLGLLQRTAMDVAGVEVIEIDSDGIVAGWFLSPRLYVALSQPLFSSASENSTEEQTRAIEIEYEAYRWLVLNLQRGGSRIGFFLKSRYAY